MGLRLAGRRSPHSLWRGPSNLVRRTCPQSNRRPGALGRSEGSRGRRSSRRSTLPALRRSGLGFCTGFMAEERHAADVHRTRSVTRMPTGSVKHMARPRRPRRLRRRLALPLAAAATTATVSTTMLAAAPMSHRVISGVNRVTVAVGRVATLPVAGRSIGAAPALSPAKGGLSAALGARLDLGIRTPLRTMNFPRVATADILVPVVLRAAVEAVPFVANGRPLRLLLGPQVAIIIACRGRSASRGRRRHFD